MAERIAALIMLTECRRNEEYYLVACHAFLTFLQEMTRTELVTF
jgi:hypothetical protein